MGCKESGNRNRERAARWTEAPLLLALGVSLLLVGCASKGPYTIDLMPAPEVFDEEVINPLAKEIDLAAVPYRGVLYVTDRAPAVEGDKDPYYGAKRGGVTRVGVANTKVAGQESTSWEEGVRLTLAETRSEKYPMYVSSVEELGLLHEVLPYGPLTDQSLLDASPVADAAFAELIDRKLAMSDVKDIFIYVHGFKVLFEKPMLVSGEIWHYLGYDGVFLSYSWPASPNLLAYMGDAETAELSGSTLRLLIEYLARNTKAERIHVLGYSQGTRVVLTAFHQLALANRDKTRAELQKELRVGMLTVVGSDYDRHKFASALADGLLKIPLMTSVYGSEHDSALSASRFLLSRDRLGNIIDELNASDSARQSLSTMEELAIINVTDAEGSKQDSGHGYFINSPWASSDVLIALKYRLSPAERGLVRSEDSFVWAFPDDYIERLRAAVIKAGSQER